jgi:hypothetical protein
MILMADDDVVICQALLLFAAVNTSTRYRSSPVWFRPAVPVRLSLLHRYFEHRPAVVKARPDGRPKLPLIEASAVPLDDSDDHDDADCRLMVICQALSLLYWYVNALTRPEEVSPCDSDQR